MDERSQQTPNKHDSHLSDRDTPDDEPVNPTLKTSDEERYYDTIHSSAIATHVALSHSTAQTNPTVDWGHTRKMVINITKRKS